MVSGKYPLLKRAKDRKRGNHGGTGAKPHPSMSPATPRPRVSNHLGKLNVRYRIHPDQPALSTMERPKKRAAEMKMRLPAGLW